ncbi:hypothetical protein BRD01_09655 [Halobacteriales archaeon QS_8_65_32]|nr:MAG: hypothetical protein BRD01_09655 [Halobacteriales archaeon QS_8_65_32]
MWYRDCPVAPSNPDDENESCPTVIESPRSVVVHAVLEATVRSGRHARLTNGDSRAVVPTPTRPKHRKVARPTIATETGIQPVIEYSLGYRIRYRNVGWFSGSVDCTTADR